MATISMCRCIMLLLMIVIVVIVIVIACKLAGVGGKATSIPIPLLQVEPTPTCHISCNGPLSGMISDAQTTRVLQLCASRSRRNPTPGLCD